MTRRTSTRQWFTAKAATAWAASLFVMIAGGFYTWTAIGVWLCDEEASPGSDAYCNDGGWETTGVVMLAAAAIAVFAPAAGLISSGRRLFWIGLFLPLLLGAMDIALSATLGRR